MFQFIQETNTINSCSSKSNRQRSRTIGKKNERPFWNVASFDHHQDSTSSSPLLCLLPALKARLIYLHPLYLTGHKTGTGIAWRGGILPKGDYYRSLEVRLMTELIFGFLVIRLCNELNDDVFCTCSAADSPSDTKILLLGQDIWTMKKQINKFKGTSPR